MSLDKWKTEQRKRLDQAEADAKASAAELASRLGVDMGDPQKNSLMHRIALALAGEDFGTE